MVDDLMMNFDRLQLRFRCTSSPETRMGGLQGLQGVSVVPIDLVNSMAAGCRAGFELMVSDNT